MVSIGPQANRLQQQLPEGRRAISAALIYGQDEPEEENANGDEEQIHQPLISYPPAGQGEFCADQDMCQEEEDQI